MRIQLAARMTQLRNGLIVGFVLLLGTLSSCSGGSVLHTSISATKCTTLSSCERSAHSAGVDTPIVTLQGKAFRFSDGFFYPRTKTDPWGYRLQYTYLPASATIEEDVTPFGTFTCEPIAGIESSITTPMGRTFCFLPDGANSEARYGLNGLLYKLYPLPPTSTASIANIRSLLENAVDSLQ